MDMDILHKVFSSEATDQEIRSVREWTESDISNKEAFLKERLLYDIINININEKPVVKTARKNTIAHTVISLLAAASCILLTVLFTHYRNCHHLCQDPEMTSNTVSTAAGQSSNISLPDGSIVCLNSLSSITYPSTFGTTSREVILSGEAYFDVSKDNSRPFIVKTSYGEIKVLGTRFNVEAYDDMGEFVTSLFSGSVQVTSKDRMITLEPDRMAYMENGELISGDIKDYNHYRWRDGLICFMDENFDYILRALTKTYGYDFIIECNKGFHNRFSGKFRKNDNIINILNILQTVIDFRYEIDDDNMTITIR